MHPKYRVQFLAGTDATGGATGASGPEGADATNETEAADTAPQATNSGDIPGVADTELYPERNREIADQSDVATTAGNAPGATLEASPGQTEPPGHVSEQVLRTPGQLDPKEVGNERMGPGTQRDLGVPDEMREEMWDNARQWGLGEPPDDVNDERAFDDGLPGSWADFSVVSPETDNVQNTSPEGAARFAEPNDDAGGEVKGPRIGGGGAIDGGPDRDHSLAERDDETKE